jgi:hypothetical protein
MSDGSRHSMSYISEGATYGATPATPAMTPLRNTGTTLGLSKDAIQSEEIRSDRQISDLRHGARKVGGDISIELSYGSYDPVLEALLGGTWAAASITAAIAAVATDNSYTDAANGFLLAGFQVGDIVAVTGFVTTAANNIAAATVTAVTAGKLTIGGTDGDVIVAEAASEDITISTTTKSQILKAGTTRRSFTIERYFSDLSANQYHRFTGCEFANAKFSINANAMIKGTFGVVGKDLVLASELIASESYTAASTKSPLDSFTGVMKEGGSAVTVVTEISLDIDNKIEPRFVVGSKTTLLPSEGRSDIKGQATVYFEDATVMNKFINETESSLELSMPDGAGNVLKILLPRIKYSGGQPDVKGEGPITLAMPFQALLSSERNTNIIVTRIPVA